MKLVLQKTFDIYKIAITIATLILTGCIFLNMNYSDYLIVKITEVFIASIALVPVFLLLSLLLAGKINLTLNKYINSLMNIWGKFMIVSFILNIALPYEIITTYIGEFSIFNLKNCVNLFLQSDSLTWMFFTHLIAPFSLIYIALSELYYYGK